VSQRLLSLAAAAGLFLLTGCGREAESGPILTGKLLAAGEPIRPASVYDFDVKFLTVEGVGPQKRSYLAQINEDGTFAVTGSISKGIPPGRYKVIVVGRVLDAKGKPSNKYAGKFAEANTPLEVEITDDSRELIIDLEQKTAKVS
jgi:hypothetical protein